MATATRKRKQRRTSVASKGYLYSQSFAVGIFEKNDLKRKEKKPQRVIHLCVDQETAEKQCAAYNARAKKLGWGFRAKVLIDRIQEHAEKIVREAAELWKKRTGQSDTVHCFPRWSGKTTTFVMTAHSKYFDLENKECRDLSGKQLLQLLVDDLIAVLNKAKSPNGMRVAAAKGGAA
jgi:hypothetical protein